MSVCVSVCLFSKEIQTAGRIGMKFGMEVVLEGGRFLGVSTQYEVGKGGPKCLWSLNCAFWQQLY